MSQFPIKSIFEQISERVFLMTNLAQAKQFTVEFVESKQINEKDKDLILKAVKESKSLVSFQRYICNALLKYESLGMKQMKDKSWRQLEGI